MSKPVYTLSLSWSPEKSPSQAEMVEAAHPALKALGLSKCQTLLVAHNDEPHPHIHALVDLVDPDTGKVRDPGMDKRNCPAGPRLTRRLRARCVASSGSKTTPAATGASPPAIPPRCPGRTSSRHGSRNEILAARQQKLLKAQRLEREALKKDAEERARAIRAELKERYRPEWVAFYKKLRQDAHDVANARRSVLAAMHVAIKERARLKPDGRAGIGSILAYTISARALDNALKQAEDRERAALRQRMNDDRRRMVKQVWDNHRREARALGSAQAKERNAPLPHHIDDDIRKRAELEAALHQRNEEARWAAERQRQRDEAARREAERLARRDPTRPERPVRLELPQFGDSTDTPAPDEATRRHEALKAEFRRQAEEITRRRKERHKKDRDRDRER